MCGIAGEIRLEVGGDDLEKRVESMLPFLLERGPDAQDIWCDENVGLAHTRLSIIDLSSIANQPMKSGDLIISFNGEIYNFQSLRKELIDAGESFRSYSDTEVIMVGYRAWGVEVLLDKLEGMFAFALYDRKQSRIILARDRFGEKPLYIYQGTGKVIFSSDIRAIWHLERPALTIDMHSVDYFLTELSVPQPSSIWKEIKQIKPGHFLAIDLEKGASEERPYWSLKRMELDFEDENQILAEVEKSLVESIQSRSHADVPVGCFLSGGVDSGLVVALLAQQSSERIRTFTVGFPSHRYNELEEARLVARRYNTVHEEIILEPNILEDLEDIICYFGEPFADSSCIPTYYVSKAIRQHVKVAISGDGGDELFGGYPEYLDAFRADQYLKRFPISPIRELVTVADKAISRLGSGRKNLGAHKALTEMSGADILYRHMGFSHAERAMLYTSDHNADYAAHYMNEVWSNRQLNGSISMSLMSTSLNTRLLNDYLVKVDRASMKNSLEVRTPFLNKSLAELAFSIPRDLVFGGGEHSKYLLKKIAQKHLDKDIFSRPKKGFGIPVGDWLIGPAREKVREYLSEDRIARRGLFDKRYVKNLTNSFLKGDVSQTHRIWSLLCLEIWFRKFVD